MILIFIATPTISYINFYCERKLTVFNLLQESRTILVENSLVMKICNRDCKSN